jgi:hypothetical protein
VTAPEARNCQVFFRHEASREDVKLRPKPLERLLGNRLKDPRHIPPIMSDLLSQDAVLSETVLKPCSKCRHPRDDHPDDGECRVGDCKCKSFGR